jgi:hypothetical protein
MWLQAVGGVSAAAAPSPLHSEWNVAAGYANSVDLFQSSGGRAYAVQTVGWSRDLIRDAGPSIAHGRFAWGIEVTPLFAQLTPSHMYGVGVAPVVWRWNFTPHRTWSAFAELSMGGLWTTEPLPENTSRVNFSAHWGGGVRLFPHGAHALLLGYRFQHFSNGNQFNANPGVNSHVVIAGWSRRK